MKQRKHRKETMARRFCLGLVLVAFLMVAIGGFLTTPGTQNVDAKKRTYKITVVGNSLMRTGSQLKYFKQIAKLYNTDVKIYNQVTDGAGIIDHVIDAKYDDNNIRKQLKKSDIVIFQEYGTEYETTYEDIVKLQKYMKKSARSYYYMTEFDGSDSALYQKLQKRGVKFIYAETLIGELYGLGYSYDDLHNSGDYHPNENNGYTAAILMFNTIFNTKCTSYPVEKCPKNYRTFLKGKNWKKKKACLKKILKKAEEIRVKGNGAFSQ